MPEEESDYINPYNSQREYEEMCRKYGEQPKWKLPGPNANVNFASGCMDGDPTYNSTKQEIARAMWFKKKRKQWKEDK